MSRPPVLKLALFGLPPDWEARYAPAIARLGQRAQVAGVFDPTPARADQAAAAVQTTSFHGIRPLLQSPGVNGLLLLDCGWHRHWSLTTVVSAGHPLFLGQDVLRSHDDWSSLPAPLASTESIVVPECLLRYQPSMLRLRELMATQLGPVERVSFGLPRARRALDMHLSLREVCNWFRTTFEVVTSEVTVNSSEPEPQTESTIALQCPTRAGRTIRLIFEGAVDQTWSSDAGTASAAGGGGAPRQRKSPVVPPDENGTSADQETPFCTVSSDSGRVELFGPRKLRCQINSNQTTEILDADRSATDVALDLFARRALGGLLPVPDLTHLDHAQRLAAVITNRLTMR